VDVEIRCRVDPGMELVVVVVLDMDRASRAGGTRSKYVCLCTSVPTLSSPRAPPSYAVSSGGLQSRHPTLDEGGCVLGRCFPFLFFAISLHCRPCQSSSRLLSTYLPYRSALIYLPTQPNPFSSSHPVYLFFHPSSAIIPTRFRIYFSVTLLHTFTYSIHNLTVLVCAL
jgi:hypothetical protein